jgi:hypothetical protein
MARESMWESRTQTVVDLLGLPSVRANTTDGQRASIERLARVDSSTPDEVKAATLYSHSDFVALFKHIGDSTRVIRVVVSAYVNLSTKAIEAGLARRYPVKAKEGNWRRQLGTTKPPQVGWLGAGSPATPPILRRRIRRPRAGGVVRHPYPRGGDESNDVVVGQTTRTPAGPTTNL